MVWWLVVMEVCPISNTKKGRSLICMARKMQWGLVYWIYCSVIHNRYSGGRIYTTVHLACSFGYLCANTSWSKVSVSSLSLNHIGHLVVWQVSFWGHWYSDVESSFCIFLSLFLVFTQIHVLKAFVVTILFYAGRTHNSSKVKCSLDQRFGVWTKVLVTNTDHLSILFLKSLIRCWILWHEYFDFCNLPIFTICTIRQNAFLEHHRRW